jgi:hypothetical protein
VLTAENSALPRRSTQRLRFDSFSNRNFRDRSTFKSRTASSSSRAARLYARHGVGGRLGSAATEWIRTRRCVLRLGGLQTQFAACRCAVRGVRLPFRSFPAIRA